MSEIIDVNVSLSRWPFRRLPCDDTTILLKKLRAHQVKQAWAGTFDGLLHKDLSSANARLAEECRAHGRSIFLPFGSINPMLPDWEEDLRRCHEVHKMRGIRLHPNYHGYKLSDPVFAALLSRAEQMGLIVQVAVLMEDKRMQHPLMPIPPVDLAPLPELLGSFPRLKLILLNSLQVLNGQLLLRLSALKQVHFDLGTLEGVDGIGKLLAQMTPNKLLFGSHAPFFNFESAMLKLKESPLTEAQRRALVWDNARRILENRAP